MKRVQSAVIATVTAAMFSTMVFAQSTEPKEQTAAQATPATTSPEQQPTKDQLAKLFDVMRIREQMKSMQRIAPSMAQEQIKSAMAQTEADLPVGTKLTPEQRNEMEKVMSKYVSKAMDLYPADEMLGDMSAIYQRHLRKDDVEGLIVFYSSPAGQHLLDAQPVIAQEYMPLVMGKVAERSRTLTQQMMKEMAEIVPTATHGAAKPAAKAGTAKPPAK